MASSSSVDSAFLGHVVIPYHHPRHQSLGAAWGQGCESVLSPILDSRWAGPGWVSGCPRRPAQGLAQGGRPIGPHTLPGTGASVRSTALCLGAMRPEALWSPGVPAPLPPELSGTPRPGDSCLPTTGKSLALPPRIIVIYPLCVQTSGCGCVCGFPS